MSLRIFGIILTLTLCAFEAAAQSMHYCDLYGSVFIEEDPAKADYIVYVEDSEAFADILVFEEENEFFADKKGIWFFTENEGFAKFSVSFTNDKSKASFTIFYIESPTFAGCQ